MDKKELKQPDAFIKTSNNILHYIEEHAKPIFSVLGIAVVVSLAYLGYSSWSQRQEGQSALAIYMVETDLKSAQKAVAEEQRKKMGELAKDASKKSAISSLEQLRPVNFQVDYKPKVDKVIAVLKENKNSRVALLSALNLADFLAENKQWETAAEVLKIPAYRPGKSDLLNGFLALQQGLVALEVGQPDQAISAYESVVNNSDMGLLHAEAMLKLGVSYQAKKDVKKATEVYEQVVQKYGSSDSANQARQFLKILKLNGTAS